MSRQLLNGVVVGFSVAAASACVHEKPTPAQGAVAVAPFTPNDTEPRVVVQRFLDATERHDFETAYQTLSSRLRDRYTPGRLATDFEAEPLAKERIERIRASLTHAFTVTSTTAVLRLGQTKALTLVREDGAWSILEIE